jgi:hypothetical protein
MQDHLDRFLGKHRELDAFVLHIRQHLCAVVNVSLANLV